MKTLISVIGLILLICCDNLMGFPTGNGSNKTHRSLLNRASRTIHRLSIQLTRSSTDDILRTAQNHVNFINGSSDLTFVLAKPMEFDERIKYIKSFISENPIHSGWLNAIASLAEANKKVAKELAIKMGKWSKDQELADEVRHNLRIQIGFNLFEHFSSEAFMKNLARLKEIPSTESLDTEQIKKNIETEINFTHDKFVTNAIKRYKDCLKGSTATKVELDEESNQLSIVLKRIRGNQVNCMREINAKLDDIFARNR